MVKPIILVALALIAGCSSPVDNRASIERLERIIQDEKHQLALNIIKHNGLMSRKTFYAENRWRMAEIRAYSEFGSITEYQQNRDLAMDVNDKIANLDKEIQKLSLEMEGQKAVISGRFKELHLLQRAKP